MRFGHQDSLRCDACLIITNNIKLETTELKREAFTPALFGAKKEFVSHTRWLTRWFKAGKMLHDISLMCHKNKGIW